MCEGVGGEGELRRGGGRNRKKYEERVTIARAKERGERLKYFSARTFCFFK